MIKKKKKIKTKKEKIGLSKITNFTINIIIKRVVLITKKIKN